MNSVFNRFILFGLKLSLLSFFLYYCLIHSFDVKKESHILFSNSRKLLRSGQRSNDSFCKSTRNFLFDMGEVKKSTETFVEWQRIQPFFIENEHARYPLVGNSNEQEYPFNHSRLNMLGPVVNICKTPLESYGFGDEEKRACGLSLLDKSSGRCVIFSLGCNNQWAFEQSIFKLTRCRVETFDCTLKPNAAPPRNLQSRVRLHNVCIGDKDVIVDGKQYLSWASILNLVGAMSPPTFLKMDIEGYEYPVLRNIIEAGINLPTQIALEIHQHVLATKWTRNKSSGELVTFINYLHTFGGYHLIDRHDNQACPHCSEILLARASCDKHPRFEDGILSLKRQRVPVLADSFRYFFG